MLPTNRVLRTVPPTTPSTLRTVPPTTPSTTPSINIPELRIVGRALVTSIEVCPAMAEGSGSVVTGRFITRKVNTTARVEIVGPEGTIEIIEGTSTHPFWSVDRNGWAPLGELAVGEQLQGSDGIATVLSLTIEQKPVSVYNIEVFGEHVYEVGELGCLVHNTCAGLPAVTKAINSDIVHAAERAVERGVFNSLAEAKEALKALGKSFKANGLPPGTISDPKRQDSVLVPFGNGHAVYEIMKNGTAVLRTVLGA